MKTPREVLLHKHRSAESRLDAIRSEVLSATCSEKVERASSGSPLLSGWHALWTNLFLPSRRIWTCVAMLWLVVIGLSIATPDVSSSTYASTIPPRNTPERQMALQEQQRLLADLLNGNLRAEARNRPYVPRPSSRALRPIRFV